MAIKHFVPKATHSFSVPTHLISIHKWFWAQKTLNKTITSSKHIYMLVGSCMWGIICKCENRMPKVARNVFNIEILGRSGTQYVAMVTRLFISSCGAHLVESYCKELNISDANWVRYPFSSYLIKLWLSMRVWHHHLANLHILKTWISLEQKEIFENSKQHFSSHAGYLFPF